MKECRDASGPDARWRRDCSFLKPRGSDMGIFPEVQRFLAAHEECCGEVTKEAGRPSVDGYRIHVACPCGAVLDRWVTPADARHDLVHSSLLAGRN
jgi:hypothetical protein